jgi:hypothetical protein
LSERGTDWLDAEEYRNNRRGDATALVTKWQLGEQYIFVSTSFVLVHGWRSGLQAKTLVRIAQRVGSIQMGFCCIYYFSFYLLFFRVLILLCYVFGSVYENGFLSYFEHLFSALRIDLSLWDLSICFEHDD